MARKKKQKITVKLDLPKDDTTLTKLYAILFVSIFLGLCTVEEVQFELSTSS